MTISPADVRVKSREPELLARQWQAEISLRKPIPVTPKRRDASWDIVLAHVYWDYSAFVIVDPQAGGIRELVEQLLESANFPEIPSHHNQRIISIL